MGSKGVAALLLACLPLGGCASFVIDSHTKVPDWPALKIVEHHVAEAEMRDRCVLYAPLFTSPQACTLFYFDRHEAHIFVSKEFPSARVLEHERLHAAGYDHFGSDAMARLWRGWQANAPSK